MTSLIKTHTPLDEVRKILSINPWSFHNFSIPECQISEGCTGVWLQTIGEEVTRDELAIAVQQAENMFSSYLGYNILPTYSKQTLYPERQFNYVARRTLQLKRRGYLQSLGSEKKELLGKFTITPTDLDADGFNETAVINISAHNQVDINQIRAFYTAQNIEIKPIKIVDVGNVRTIQFPMYLIPKWNKVYPLCEEELDSSDSDNYETEIDVFRIYPDTTDQIKLIYYPNPGCGSDCDKTRYDACGYVTRKDLGYFAYNHTTEPNEVEVKFFSGWTGDVERPLVDVDPKWVLPITALAVSLLDPSKSCCGGNTPKIMSMYQTDLTLSDEDNSRFVIEKILLENFGANTKGSYFAQQFAETLRLFPL